MQGAGAQTGARALRAGPPLWLLLATLPHSACLVPEPPRDLYADAAPYAPLDAGQPADSDAGGAADDSASLHDAAERDGSPFDSDASLPPPADCDFRGRWLVTERLVASGIGIQQAVLWWLYLEVAQSGSELRVQKGLVCGSAANRVGSLGVAVEMRAAWPALQAKNDPRGRSGSALAGANGCDVRWSRFTRVMGASMPYYVDEDRALPELQQPASGAEPGWEDWDGDGQPGVSMHISGVLNGTRYSSSRTWASYAGVVDKRASQFRLAADWNQQESLLGVTSEALKATGVKDADASLHFALFARLADGQASGSDDEICAAVRALAPELTADAY